MVKHSLVALLVGAGFTFTACGLPANVLYGCASDADCVREGFVCQDGTCVPPELVRDGGAKGGGGGSVDDDGGTKGGGGGSTGGGGGSTGGGGGSTGGGGGSTGGGGGSTGGGGGSTGGGGGSTGGGGGTMGGGGGTTGGGGGTTGGGGGTTGGGGGTTGGGGGTTGGGGGSAGDAGLPPCDCSNVACGYTPQQAGCETTFCRYCAAGRHCGAVTPNTCSPTVLCTADGWCGENPLPLGQDLRGAWASHARSVFVVGDDLAMLHFDGERFSLMTPPGSLARSTDLLAVHGFGTKAWAVGTGGTILHFDGTSWAVEASGVTTTLRAVLGVPTSGGGTAYAAGDNGVLLRRIGTSWTPVTISPVEDLNALALDGRGTVRVFGDWTGRIWSARPPDLDAFSLEVQLNMSGQALFARGDEWYALGDTQRADGGWRSVLVRTTFAFDGGEVRDVFDRPFTALTGDPTGGALYLGGYGEFARWAPDAGLSVKFPNNNEDYFATTLLAPQHVLSVGTGGSISACVPPCTQPTHWRDLSKGTTRDLLGLCGRTEDTLVAVGEVSCSSSGCASRLLERLPTAGGLEWLTDDTTANPDGGDFLACVTPTASETWAFMGTGQYAKRTGPAGNSWVLQPSPFSAPFAAAHYSSQEDRVYVLTRGGPFYELSPAGATTAQWAGPPTPQYALWHERDKFISVGDGGSAYFIDPSQMQAFSDSYIPDTRTQRDLHGATFADGGLLLVAAGDQGAVAWRVSGMSSFRMLPNTGSRNYTGAWAHRSGRAWLTATSGEVVEVVPERADAGLPWTVYRIPTAGPLSDVWGLDLPDGGVSVWVVGKDGLVMRKDF